MNTDEAETERSLADQAAEWVPPWERASTGDSSEPPAEPTSPAADVAEPPADDRAEIEADLAGNATAGPPAEPAEAELPHAEPVRPPEQYEPAEPTWAESALTGPTQALPTLSGYTPHGQTPPGQTPGDPTSAEPAPRGGEPEESAPPTEPEQPDDDRDPEPPEPPDAVITASGLEREPESEPEWQPETPWEALWAETHGGPGTEPVYAETNGRRASDDAEPEEAAPAMAPAQVRGALEAIMLVVDVPVSEVVLAQVLEQPTEVVIDALHALHDEYALTGRGFELRRAAGGWRLYTRGDYASYVERFVLDGQQVRVTQAALETLAVVAYKQPVTRSRISAIRGVNCDAVVRTLVSRGLIEECGIEPDSGAHLYKTTTLFLEKLGLDSVDELPALAPFLPDDVDEIADAQS